jgi:hypothetical protein
MRTSKEVHQRTMDLEEVEIAPISVEELTADKTGALVEQIVALVYRHCRQTPSHRLLPQPVAAKGF